MAWRRAFLVVPVGLGLIWLSVSVTAAAVLRDNAPAWAERLAPYDALTRAHQADLLISADPGLVGRNRAERLAKGALARDPTVIGAWRTLGLIAAAEGRADQATKLIGFASRLSRRDLATQMWLIEDAVRRNDVLGALDHYDFALRTSNQASDLLLPILVSALSQKNLVNPIASLLASDPPWLPQYFAAIGQHLPPGQNIAELVESLRKTGYSKAIPNASSLPAQLIGRADYQSAFRIHRALEAGEGTIARPGDQFGRNPRTVPFDWELASEGDLHAEPETRDKNQGNSALHVVGGNETSGIVASKLMILAPGTYRLRTIVRGSDTPMPESLKWTIRCAAPSVLLSEVDVTPPRSLRRAYERSFVVPASGCPAQWVRLEARMNEGTETSELWIEEFEIEPAGER